MTEAVETLIAPFLEKDGGLLRALHALQASEGYIDAAHIPVVAGAFNLSKAEVKGVISFYADFRRAPAGRYHVKICQAESCQAVGSRRLTEKALTALGIKLGDTTVSGAVTVDAVYCLGLCAAGPAAMIDGTLRARLDADGFAAEIQALAEEGA